MKWNPTTVSSTRTDAKSASMVTGTASVRRGNVAYRQEWDNKRSMLEGLQRVTWVYRAVDAIASNAARLPLIVRQSNIFDGEEIDDPSLYRLLNSKPNPGEDSIAFRYRLSAQLLLSRKGAFIEVTRSNRGEVIKLMLLQPENVSIIPDREKFIKGYDYEFFGQNGEQKVKRYKPEDILWIRKPHPFNPYGAITPLEAAGVAIETDWLAKMYNRNFMLNDGRPGGIVVVKGDMMESDKEELRAKFGGGIARAGRISVIASEDGADFVDTAVTPRDAQYQETRTATKEEILIAFGVPESVLSNAAGRSFDNAEMERIIFWMETMVPHMDLITRPMDALDSGEDVFLTYDLSRVDVLQRVEMKRREFLLREADGGAISFNEYRYSTGRELVDHPSADLLWIPKTKAPVVTTDGDIEVEYAATVREDILGEATPNPVGKPPVSAVTEEPEDEPRENEGDERLTPLANTPNSAPATRTEENAEVLQAKGANGVEEVEEDLWATITESALTQLVERAARVTAEKVGGRQFRKAFLSESSSEELLAAAFTPEVWNKQLFDDLLPVAKGILSSKGEDGGAELRSIHAPALVWVIQEAISAQLEKELAVEKTDFQSMPSRVEAAVLGCLEDVPGEAQVFSEFYLSS